MKMYFMKNSGSEGFRRCRRIPAIKSAHAAFTLIELLVVIAIISLLVSILLPSLNKAKDLAKQTVCATTLRQWGTGIHMYLSENDDVFPQFLHVPFPYGPEWKSVWFNVLAPYMGYPSRNDLEYLYLDNMEARRCPSGEAGLGVHYGAFYTDPAKAPFVYRVPYPNGGAISVNIDDIRSPSSFIAMMDLAPVNGSYFMYSPANWTFSVDMDGDGIPESYLDHPLWYHNGAAPKVHGGRSNVLLCDGHAETLDYETWVDLDNGYWLSNE